MAECELALRLDPGNYQFRSCSTPFLWTGQFERGMAFARLDAGSEWSSNVLVAFLLRQGKTSEALESLHKLPDSPFFHTRALESCYTMPRTADFEQLMEKVKKDSFGYRDPEPQYSFAALYNPCLGNAFTARLLETAIRSGYCSYDSIRRSWNFGSRRHTPQYWQKPNSAGTNFWPSASRMRRRVLEGLGRTRFRGHGRRR